MPTYEYQCPKCGTFEVEQRIIEPALEKCPTHPEEAVKKLISRSGFALKGGGWYSQGYGNSGSSSSSDSAPATCGAGACAATGTCQGDSN